MKIKTSELVGAQLDWAVAKCEHPEWTESMGPANAAHVSHYSTGWAQGGLIIERELITLSDANGSWVAGYRGTLNCFGPTPLSAAMRCYVASKLGHEVEIPDELI